MQQAVINVVLTLIDVQQVPLVGKVHLVRGQIPVMVVGIVVVRHPLLSEIVGTNEAPPHLA